MKQKSKIALAVILSLSLIGCGGDDTPKAPQYLGSAGVGDYSSYGEDVQSAAAPMLAGEQQELAQILRELQKGDPSIRDAYYGVDQAGERVLHIVRNETPNYQPGQPVSENDSMSETIWPLVAGIGGGMLLANMMNSSGGYNNYMDRHPPYSSTRYVERDRVVHRTTVVKNYTTNVYRNTSTALKSNPGFKPKSFADVPKTPLTAKHTTQTVKQPSFQQKAPVKSTVQTVNRPSFQPKPTPAPVKTQTHSVSKPSFSKPKTSYSRSSFSSSRSFSSGRRR